MTKDKMLLVLLLAIAVASFCGGFFIVDCFEKRGALQGQPTWLFLNGKFRVLLADAENRNAFKTQEEQAIYARLLNNVGSTSGYTDQWKDSLLHLERALDFKIAHKSVSPESMISAIETLGKAYYHLGRYDISKTALDFAARDWVHERGDDCKPYARCLNYTGLIYRALGNYSSAENCFARAKAIYKKEDDKTSAARSYLLLAEIALYRKDIAGARSNIESATRYLVDEYGYDYKNYFNDEVAFLECLEGELCVAEGSSAQVEKGISKLENGLQKIKITFGECDVFTLSIQLKLIEAYLKKGDQSTALSQLEKIESNMMKVGLGKHPFLSNVLHLKAQALRYTDSALSDRLMAKSRELKFVSTVQSRSEADQLAKKLDTSKKFLVGRTFNDPWIWPFTSQIIAWAFAGMFACAMACAAQAGRKHYSPSVSFIAGVIFNFAAYLVISALPTKNKESSELTTDYATISDARTGVFVLSMAPLVCILGASIFYSPIPLRNIFISAFIGFVFCWILMPPIWCFAVSRIKGRNPIIWTFLGILFNIFGLTALLLVNKTEKSQADEFEAINSNAETTMLITSCIHAALFISMVVNIADSWMLHLEL